MRTAKVDENNHEPRHAFLILAHTNAAQVRRLIDSLNHPAFSFFIHVDKKSNVDEFETALEGAQATYTAQRFDVYRGCWSMVEATIELLQTALDAPTNFSYYTLLSGADYPIKTPSYIHGLLSREEGELLHFVPAGDRPQTLRAFHRRSYLDDVQLESNSLSPFMRGVRISLNRAKRVSHRLLDRTPLRWGMPKDMQPFFGSQWWSITHDCAIYVTQQLRSRAIRRYFRYVIRPHERVVQCIVMNSPFRLSVKADENYRRCHTSEATASLPEWHFNYRHINWDPDRRDAGGHPVTLRMQDFDDLRDSPAIFARKFDSVQSAELMDRIDRELLQ